MRDHSGHRVAARHEAVEALMARWEFTRRVETVPVAQAAGRVAAARVRSLVTLPNTRISNLDAIAVRFDDFADGMPDLGAWERGEQWQFCNTGIAMPDGFDTAIRIEDVQLDEQTGKLLGLASMPQERHEMTSPAGCAIREGDVLVRAGEEITPLHVALLAMGGHVHVDVTARARVAYIPTGNELVDPAAQVPRGKNIESNGAMICAKVAQWGGIAQRFDIVPDSPGIILAALRRAACEADIIVINAGSSKGSDDYTCELLEEHGEVLFHEVSQGPGRHCSFSLFEGVPVIGISGPPIGAEFTADFFVKPFVDLFAGGAVESAPVVDAVMLDSFECRPRPMTIARRAVLRRVPEGGFVAWLVDSEERPVLRGYADCNAMVLVAPDSFGWREGDVQQVELRYPYTLPPLA